MPPPIPTIDVKEAIAAITSISSTLFICVEACFGEMSKINCKAAKVNETAMREKMHICFAFWTHVPSFDNIITSFPTFQK